MKNILYLLLCASLATSGCGKNENQDCEITVTSAPAGETDAVRLYLDENSINAEKHEKGFYYTISEMGTGQQPNACDNIRVNYIGRLKNGNIFDQANGVSFNLSGLIQGWQAGIPLIQAGGKITLYLPPSHGYGSQGSNSVPPNALLIFTIDLLEVN